MVKDDQKQTKKVAEILKGRREQFKHQYAADSLGVGYKIKDGRLTDKVALIFYVKKKKSKEELLSEGLLPIPEEIEGIPTDVVAVPEGIKARQ
jgi:hypothetical protein